MRFMISYTTWFRICFDSDLFLSETRWGDIVSIPFSRRQVCNAENIRQKNNRLQCLLSVRTQQSRFVCTDGGGGTFYIDFIWCIIRISTVCEGARVREISRCLYVGARPSSWSFNPPRVMFFFFRRIKSKNVI